jgi:hypothetical protein
VSGLRANVRAVLGFASAMKCAILVLIGFLVFHTWGMDLEMLSSSFLDMTWIMFLNFDFVVQVVLLSSSRTV